MREAYQEFKQASERGYAESTKELAECYLHGKGCERNLAKAAELDNKKAILELGVKMERG